MARITVTLSDGEWILVMNALNEVLHGPDAVDDWEFHARLGVQRAEALALQHRLHEEQ
jgi:hypothetical protein